MKKLLIILTPLNFIDYVLALLNRGNFEEVNPLTNLIINNTIALTILKLGFVPACILVLWRVKPKPYVKLLTASLCVIYMYAVVLGLLLYFTT